jgi:hypothetical protein
MALCQISELLLLCHDVVASIYEFSVASRVSRTFATFEHEEILILRV